MLAKVLSKKPGLNGLHAGEGIVQETQFLAPTRALEGFLSDKLAQ